MICFSQIPDLRRSGLSAAAPAVTMRTLSQCKEATTVTLTEAQPVALPLTTHSSNGNGVKQQEEEEESILIAR